MEALYFSGAHVMLRPVLGGVGVILTLHNVRPQRLDRFQPNRLLEVNPAFFERVIRRLRQSGADLISLDEMHRRMTHQDFSKRFVCITFDDGYRDTRDFAYPVLKKYEVPFAVYVATGFADRVGEMWWLALEAVIAKNELIGLRLDGRDQWFECRNADEKQAVFEHIYWWLRRRETEEELRQVVRELAARYHVDTANCCCRRPAGHDRSPHGQSRDPFQGDRNRRAVRTHKQPGRDRSRAWRAAAASCLSGGGSNVRGPAGIQDRSRTRFKTAVTTRPGAIFRGHTGHLTALPRVSLNGEFQRPRYARVLVSGAATSLWNGFRPINVT